MSCTPAEIPLTAAYQAFLDELTGAGLLINLGVPGLYGHGSMFEYVIERFERHVTQCGAHLNAESMRFPPVINRAHYLKTTHIDTFPDLMGSVHSFRGNEKDHAALLQKRDAGEDWSKDLIPTQVMMAPAVCYPLYPTASGVLPANGRTVDLRGNVFRHEPSIDPARMQSFRMHEYVRLGTPEQALAHRDYWLKLAQEILNAVGLDVKPEVANDPFFGRGGKVMAATQKEQYLKYELVIPIASAEKPTAVASCNYHLDHFSHAFNIKTVDGKDAHTACVGFGLERVALALFRTHGFDPKRWPTAVKQVLEL